MYLPVARVDEPFDVSSKSSGGLARIILMAVGIRLTLKSLPNEVLLLTLLKASPSVMLSFAFFMPKKKSAIFWPTERGLASR